MTADQDLEATVVRAYGTVFPPHTYPGAKAAVIKLAEYAGGRQKAVVGKALWFAFKMAGCADECDFDRFPHAWDWTTGRSVRTTDYPRPQNQHDHAAMLTHFLGIYRKEQAILARKAQLQRQADLAHKFFSRSKR